MQVEYMTDKENIGAFISFLSFFNINFNVLLGFFLVFVQFHL